MIRWLKKLFGKSEDPRDAALRQLMDSIPDELITQLAANLAAAERDKALSQGYFLSASEQAKLEKEIEYRLRNPGKHKGQISVRVEKLIESRAPSSGSSSSPISSR